MNPIGIGRPVAHESRAAARQAPQLAVDVLRLHTAAWPVHAAKAGLHCEVRLRQVHCALVVHPFLQFSSTARASSIAMHLFDHGVDAVNNSSRSRATNSTSISRRIPSNSNTGLRATGPFRPPWVAYKTRDTGSALSGAWPLPTPHADCKDTVHWRAPSSQSQVGRWKTQRPAQLLTFNHSPHHGIASSQQGRSCARSPQASAARTATADALGRFGHRRHHIDFSPAAPSGTTGGGVTSRAARKS